MEMAGLFPAEYPGGFRAPESDSANHLFRQDQERWWHRDPKRLGSLEIDDQLELHGLLDG
jgi:hypothetical protein